MYSAVPCSSEDGMILARAGRRSVLRYRDCTQILCTWGIDSVPRCSVLRYSVPKDRFSTQILCTQGIDSVLRYSVIRYSVLRDRFCTQIFCN